MCSAAVFVFSQSTLTVCKLSQAILGYTEVFSELFRALSVVKLVSLKIKPFRRSTPGSAPCLDLIFCVWLLRILLSC